MVIADPRLGSQEPLLKKLYEVYADYALKNPFYSIDMPIRLGIQEFNMLIGHNCFQ